MASEDITIRTSTARDKSGIQTIYLHAFPETENETIVKLVTELLSLKASKPVVDLLAETKDEAAGHIIFSPVTIDGTEDIQAYILAPLGVKPEYQRLGIGSRLIEHGLKALTDMSVDIVFVYGDPEYYGRFGFSADTALHFMAPYELEYPYGWQAFKIKPFDIETSPATITCVPPLSDPKLW